MKSVPITRTAAVVSVAAALLALSYNGIAHAITGSIFQYTNPKQGYFSISPSDLGPETFGYADTFAINAPFFVHPTTGNATCLVGGVHLPNGAQISEITSWVSSDLFAGARVTLYRSNPATGDSTGLSALLSSDSTQTRETIGQTFPATALTKVSNQHFNYSMLVCLFSGSSNFYGSRIAYTYTEAGD